eukprot:4008248-Amphidinium_carterae.1
MGMAQNSLTSGSLADPFHCLIVRRMHSQKLRRYLAHRQDKSVNAIRSCTLAIDQKESSVFP